MSAMSGCMSLSPSRQAAAPLRAKVSAARAGNANRKVAVMKSDTGPFAPIVRSTRAVVGDKKFNQFRGKAISLHSQVIKEFCNTIGASRKQAQAVIKLAKKNGDWLGFLA